MKASIPEAKANIDCFPMRGFATAVISFLNKFKVRERDQTNPKVSGGRLSLVADLDLILVLLVVEVVLSTVVVPPPSSLLEVGVFLLLLIAVEVDDLFLLGIFASCEFEKKYYEVLKRLKIFFYVLIFSIFRDKNEKMKKSRKENLHDKRRSSSI